MRTHSDTDPMEQEFDFTRARRPGGPRFPEGFDIRIDGATGYSLRLIPSNKVLGRYASAREAWPTVIAQIERGIPARCLVLDAFFANGERDRVASGLALEATARAGLGTAVAPRPTRRAS
jgi:hypothetical protein